VTVTIQPSIIEGTITAPAGKSSMQRACALALLHNGETIISNPGKSNDDLAAVNFIKYLGADISKLSTGDIKIHSNNFPGSSKASSFGGGLEGAWVSCGESGLGLRMFAPIAALSSQEITISGKGSLLNRPMDFFDEIFPQLGVAIRSNKGKLPIQIKGPLQPGDITIDGSLSSQFLTGLLMAFAKAVKKQVTIRVTNLKSKPYIDLTLQMMKHFDYEVENDNYEKFIIKPQIPNAKHQAYTVEGDWSGAAFLLVAGAIAGDITVKGLDESSTQADRAILQALMMANAGISITGNEITVSSPPLGDRGKAFLFNATDCPDLFPPLVALAAYCEGISVIEGVSRLAHKESDRSVTLMEEFKKMGVEIRVQDNLMMIKGGAGVKATTLRSHHDHRIAMACAVAALKAEGTMIIEDAEAINKSYPCFYEDLKMLGADVSLQN
jgi:3-phosphoshikimate 1-carboxyvinyltransferase